MEGAQCCTTHGVFFYENPTLLLVVDDKLLSISRNHTPANDAKGHHKDSLARLCDLVSCPETVQYLRVG
jgi:hypothetical protein